MPEKVFILPKDIPLDRYPGPEVFLREGKRLVEAAQQKGLVLRVMGPMALHYRFPDHIELYASLERLGDRYFTDIDFAAYGKQSGKIKSFMEEMDYACDLHTMMSFGKVRHIYFGGAVPMIDVFYDALDMNHKVDYKGRLELDSYCVTLTDTLLQKLQIWEINDKDLKDIEFLFVTAPIGDSDHNEINQAYIARRFADDWGFWYTATTNLGRVKEHCANVTALTDEHRTLIRQKADQLLARIEAEPKSKGWNKRAKKGANKPWYNVVSDWD